MAVILLRIWDASRWGRPADSLTGRRCAGERGRARRGRTPPRRSAAVASSGSARWLKDSRSERAPPLPDEERGARDVGDAGGDGVRAQRGGVQPLGQRHPGQEAARGLRPGDALGHAARASAADERRPVRGVELARGRQVALEAAGAAVLLEQPLAEAARALVRVALRGDQLGDDVAPGRPPSRAARRGRSSWRTSPPGRRRRARATTASAAARRPTRARGRRRPRRRARRGGGRARRARGGARAAACARSGSGTRGSCRRTSGAARPRAAPRARRRRRPSLVHLDRHDLGLRGGEGHQRAEVARRLDHDRVAGVDQRGAHQRDALHPAAGDHQLAGVGPPPLRRLDAVEQVLAHAGQAGDRRVLHRHRRVVAQQPRGDRVELVRRERRRVGEAAGHRQHAGRAAGEDRRELLAAAQPGPPGEGVREVSHRPGRPSRLCLAAVERRDVLVVVGQAVQRLAARLGGEDRALGAADRLGGRRAPPRSAPPSRSAARRRRRRRSRPGRTAMPPNVDLLAGRGARDRRARARRGAAGEDRQPDRAQPAQVAAEAVADDPGEPAAAAPRWRTARRRPRACRRRSRRRARRRARPRRARSSPAGGRPRPRRCTRGRPSGRRAPSRGRRGRPPGASCRRPRARRRRWRAAARAGPPEEACHMRGAGPRPAAEG